MAPTLKTNIYVPTNEDEQYITAEILNSMALWEQAIPGLELRLNPEIEVGDNFKSKHWDPLGAAVDQDLTTATVPTVYPLAQTNDVFPISNIRTLLTGICEHVITISGSNLEEASAEFRRQAVKLLRNRAKTFLYWYLVRSAAKWDLTYTSNLHTESNVSATLGGTAKTLTYAMLRSAMFRLGDGSMRLQSIIMPSQCFEDLAADIQNAVSSGSAQLVSDPANGLYIKRFFKVPELAGLNFIIDNDLPTIAEKASSNASAGVGNRKQFYWLLIGTNPEGGSNMGLHFGEVKLRSAPTINEGYQLDMIAWQRIMPFTRGIKYDTATTNPTLTNIQDVTKYTVRRTDDHRYLPLVVGKNDATKA